MKIKRFVSAIITIKEFIPSSDATSSSSSEMLYAQLLLMVRKGDHLDPVNTDCFTEKVRCHPQGQGGFIWDEAFNVPVDRERDALLFRVHGGGLADSIVGIGESLVGVAVVPVKHITSLDTVHEYELELFDPNIPEPPENANTDAEMRNTSATSLTTKKSAGEMDKVVNQESVVTGRTSLQLTPTPPEIGTLRVTVQLVEQEMSLIEKEDLKAMNSIPLKHKVDAVQARFLGIGELANILLQERFTDDVDVVWDQAIAILTEQRAYAMWEESKCNDDVKNYQQAEREIIRDHGLWDGL